MARSSSWVTTTRASHVVYVLIGLPRSHQIHNRRRPERISGRKQDVMHTCLAGMSAVEPEKCSATRRLQTYYNLLITKGFIL